MEAAKETSQAILQVENLSVDFAMRRGSIRAVRGVDFSVDKGERLGIVGESGAGKSLTGFAVLNMIPKPGSISGGRVLFEGRDLAALPDEEMRRIRGDRISMIFQDPLMTLNPVLKIGTQMVETLQAHTSISNRDALARSEEALAKVCIPSPKKRLDQYPFELSGGMRQRVVIAIALLSHPALIIADEPTTALDVTIQAEIMDLLTELCESEHAGLILITHDLAVVSQVTKRICVMYAGRIVESGPTNIIVERPSHPYTQGLLGALPQCGGAQHRLNQIPGVMPSLKSIPEGCAFHNRCASKERMCEKEQPKLRQTEDGTLVACHCI
jgi:peptide/nickel transport system ATP-binding protein